MQQVIRRGSIVSHMVAIIGEVVCMTKEIAPDLRKNQI